jgi:peptidoglycan L-alanyl-D-glutamate endopeptidase CwlK
MNVFGTTSLSRLEQTHPDLQKVFKEAIKEAPFDFSITCGLRTKEEQQKLFNEGKSKTMNSRHLTGNAVDVCVLVGGKASWAFENYSKLSEHVLKVAKELNIPLVWGGSWESFKDGPHFELDRKKYP